jgi:hypothetical protein
VLLVAPSSQPFALRSGLFNRCVLDESYRRHYSASARGGGEAPMKGHSYFVFAGLGLFSLEWGGLHLILSERG